MSNDPLEALRQPDHPMAPRAEFVDALRRSLEKELDMTTTDPTGNVSTTGATTADVRYRTLRPNLCVDGGPAAIAFYEQAFGAVVTLRMEDGAGRIGYAELQVGDVVFMLADEFPDLGFVSPTTLGGTPTMLNIEVSDVDTVVEQAAAAGATVERPPEDQFHGNRTATLLDPFGHRWTITAPVEALSIDELAGRAVEDGYATTGQPARAPSELGYFTLTVPDVERAAAFYGSLFGWAFEEATVSPEGTYRHVSNTSVPFGLVDFASMPSPLHYYRVDDLDAAVAKVRALGGEVLEVSDHPSGGGAKCRDDQGVEFELWKPAPEYE